MPDDLPHDPWADYYDCVYKLTFGECYQQFTDRTLRLIQERAGPPPARIIEFGAGTGRLAIPLAQLGYQVTAVEASASMCGVLRAKAQAGVEGAVVKPCVACQSRFVPEAQQRPVKPEILKVLNQTVCERLPVDDFDLGACVFTVLNYLVDAPRLGQFATVAAGAVRPGGSLLVSFVENMKPMQAFFNGSPKVGRSQDGRCSVERKVKIQHTEGRLFEYQEASKFTRDELPLEYEDRFPLREWSRAEIMATLKAEGFRLEADLRDKFAATGEAYLMFQRSPGRTSPWKVPPGWEKGEFPPPKTTRIILDLEQDREGDV